MLERLEAMRAGDEPGPAEAAIAGEGIAELADSLEQVLATLPRPKISKLKPRLG